MYKDDAVYFDDCTALHDSGKALLIKIPELFGDDDDEAQWVPKSQIHDDSEVCDAADNRRGTLAVTSWFADLKEWA